MKSRQSGEPASPEGTKSVNADRPSAPTRGVITSDLSQPPGKSSPSRARLHRWRPSPESRRRGRYPLPPFPQSHRHRRGCVQHRCRRALRGGKAAVATLEPWPAVVAFLDAFIRYARTKQTLLSELQQAFEKNPAMRSHARDLIDSAFDLVIDRAKEAGVIRGDVDGRDVTQLVSPVCTNPSNSVEKSERLVSMVLDGLRYPAEMSGRR